MEHGWTITSTNKNLNPSHSLLGLRATLAAVSELRLGSLCAQQFATAVCLTRGMCMSVLLLQFVPALLSP